MGNLTVVIGADTSGFQKAINEAKLTLDKYVNASKDASAAISKNTSATNELVTSYNRVVTALNKVASGTMTTKQQLKALETQIKELKIQWANLSDEVKSSDLGKAISSSLRAAERHLDVLNRLLDQTSNKMAKVGNTGSIGKVGSVDKSSSFSVKSSGFDNLSNLLGQVSNAMGVLGAKGSSTLDNLSSMAGMMSNPYVIAGAAVAGAAVAVADYGIELDKVASKTLELTGLSRTNSTALAMGVKSVCDVYGVDFNEAISATNTMAKQMGISYDDALSVIEVGFATGANSSGDFLDLIKEYSPLLKEAGISAEGMVSIITQSLKLGIFTDKAVDAIKEANSRLREMPQSTQDALNAIGLSSSEIQKGLREGTTTTFDVMQLVSEKLNELPENSSEVGLAIADIFGGPGEDAGLQYIKTIKDIDTSMDGLKGNMTESQKATEDLQLADKQLQEAMASLFGVSNNGWNTFVTTLKTKVYKAIANAVNWFIDLYNQTITLRGSIALLGLVFKATWYIIKDICKAFANTLVGIGKIMNDILTGDFGSIVSHINEANAAISKNFSDLGKGLQKAWDDAINLAFNGHIAHVKFEAEGDIKVDDKTNNKSLSYLEKKLLKLKDDYKKGVIKITPDDYKKLVAELEKAIKKAKKKGGTGGKTGTGGITQSVKVKPEKGSLTDLENLLSDLKKKYKDGILKITPDDYRKQVKELEKQIEDKKIKLKIDFEADVENLSKDIDKALEPKKESKKVEEYKTTGINEKEEPPTPEENISLMKELVEENDNAINSNLQKIAELKEEQNNLNNLIARMNELLGEDKGNWSSKQIEQYDKLSEKLKDCKDGIEELEGTNSNLINTNTELVDNINGTQDSLEKTKEKIKGVTDTLDMISSLGSSFSTMGSAIGGTEGEMISLLGTTLSSVALMIPQIMALFSALEAEAIGGATASGAKLPFPANIAAIAAGVASVIAAFANASFADGGIVGGATTIGDYNVCRLNRGEMVLNGTQQSRLFKMLSGNTYTGASDGYTTSTIKLKGSDIYIALKNLGKMNPNGIKL